MGNIERDLVNFHEKIHFELLDETKTNSYVKYMMCIKYKPFVLANPMTEREVSLDPSETIPYHFTYGFFFFSL